MTTPRQTEASAPFTERLRRRRRELDLTQEQLAELVGYASATLRKIERGERRPSREMAERLADALALAGEERVTFLRLARVAERPDSPPAKTAAHRLPPSVALTRLQPPPLRASFVPRPRLNNRIAALEPRAITLVVAPAGWGKTTAVCAWLAGLDAPARSRVAWLALDPGDDDPATLLRELIIAIQQVEARFGASALGLLETPEPFLDAVAGLLLDDLANLAQPLVLVLDDCHFLHDRAARHLLGLVLEHLPAAVHLILVSREDPALPLARLRVRGQLVELRAADLRFTGEEATALLDELLKLPLDPAVVASLVQRTEGWAAGLQLAALALRERDDPEQFALEFSGSHRLVLDFLAEEVLDRLPDHLRRFLMATAILERFCGPLCDALLLGSDADGSAPGEAYSQSILEELERAQLFLVPLDGTRTWYRYHHLFGQVLRARLVRGVSSAEVKGLHAAAATWHAGQGLWREAFQHAREAEQWELAAAALEQFSEQLLLGSADRLRTLLLALPEDVRAAHHRLLLCYGRCLLRGQETAGAVAALERAVAVATERGDLAVRGEALVLLSDCQRGAGDFVTAHTTLQEALAAPLPPWARVTALVSRAFEALAAGDWRGAVSALDAALVLVLPSTDRQVWMALASNTHSLLLALPGRVAWAGSLVEATLPWTEPPLSTLNTARAWIAGYCALLRGDLEAATDSFTTVLASNRELGGDDKLYLDAGLQYVLLTAVCGDLAEADRQLMAVLARLDDPALAVYKQVFGSLYHFVHGWLRLQQGRREEARAIATFLETPGPAEWPIAPAARQLLGGLVALADGQGAKAETLLREAVTLQARFADAFVIGDARVALAAAARLAGRSYEAQAIMRAALDGQAERGTPGLLLLSGSAVVVPLLRLDHAHSIRPELSARLPEELGEPVEQPAEAGPPGPPASPDALTAREREVLQLLARGASNQSIADTLVISLPTAKTHVARILAKLGAANRTEAIARARNQGLLAAS